VLSIHYDPIRANLKVIEGSFHSQQGGPMDIEKINLCSVYPADRPIQRISPDQPG